MSDVRLSVGGRYYTVACPDGQEDHIRHLASMVDAKLSGMGTNLSTQEAKNLLFAAILLADDVDSASREPVAPSADEEQVAGRLERIADALENVVASLEADS